MSGEFAARKLQKSRQHFRWKRRGYKYKVLNWRKTKNPLEGAPQATGLVLAKRMVEQKQPSSGMIKAVRVRLLKNGKELTAFVPRSGAINHIAEHDHVTIEGLGGSQKGPIGSMWGVRWKVVKVNGISLEEIRKGKKQKPTR
ncbi:MAG: 30S ribosomal protein S12 [Candidatus Aenigmarchaeota archaeon]|nr:30S ribosomal protein S12 [Candidatus Aenigmarchaeota archaeon]